MALIPSLAEIKDLVTVNPDEYALRIIRAMPITSKKTGRTGVMMVVGFEDVDDAKDIIHNLWFGMPSDDAAKIEIMGRMMKEFFQAIGLDADNDLEDDDLVGVQFNALVDIEEQDNGMISNIIKRVV